MDSEFAQSRKSSLESELEQVNGELAAIENELNKLYARHEILKERQSLLQVQIQSLDQVALEEETARHQSIDWEQGRFPWTDTVYSILRDTFKLNQFRPLQLSCINATLSQKDTVLIMPTGGGKSLCYQLPAVANKGFSLVISPLVALMEDQLISVRRFGIESAMLNASSPREEVNRVHAAMTDTGKESLKLLYVTPEKISKSKRFMAKLEKAYDKKKLTGIIIDEVHCASQWGHDFRPDYKILGILKRQFPSVPIVGLTATATSKVLEDCKAILNLKSCLVFKASYNRPNLVYDVRYKPSGFQDQLEQIAELIKLKFAKQSGQLSGFFVPCCVCTASTVYYIYTCTYMQALYTVSLRRILSRYPLSCASGILVQCIIMAGWKLIQELGHISSGSIIMLRSVHYMQLLNDREISLNIICLGNGSYCGFWDGHR